MRERSGALSLSTNARSQGEFTEHNTTYDRLAGPDLCHFLAALAAYSSLCIQNDPNETLTHIIYTHIYLHICMCIYVCV